MIDKIAEWYSKILAEYPGLVLSIIIASAIVSGMWASHMKITAYDYKHMLTDDPIANAMFKMEDEFSISGSSVVILVNSKDVRSPAVLDYINKIDTAVDSIPGVASVTSPDTMVKRVCGRIPKTYADSIECFNKKITIKSPTMEIGEKLKNVSNGLLSMSSLIEKESDVLSEMGKGLNMSAYALFSVSTGLGQTASALNPPSMTISEELAANLENLYVSILSSNATLEQKQEELSYLAKIQDALKTMKSKSEQSTKNIITLRSGLAGTSSGIGQIGEGIKNASMGVNKLSTMDSKISNNLKEISQGMEKIAPIISMFMPKGGQEEIINPFDNLVSPDNRSAQIIITLYSMPKAEQEEVGTEVKQVVLEIPKPPGTTVQFTGSPIMDKEIETSSRQNMSKTSSISMIAIIFIVILLFRSIKHGLTSLMAIVFGSIWTYGMIVLLGVTMSQTSSGALSMIFGVGIDFGIQVVNRFREEIQKKSLQEALETTLVSVGKPMTVTAISALIGFNAMSLGHLKMMSELGNIMSMGVFFSYIAALVVVPTVLSLIYRYSKHRHNMQRRKQKLKI